MLGWLSRGALNHLLSQADWARARLIPFAGMHARLSMSPWQLDLAIRVDGTFAAAAATEPDVTMILPADAPIRALQGQDKVLEAAQVEGNAHLATELSFVLRNLRWDAEEDLSRLVGDIAARRLTQGASDFTAWQRGAVSRFAENVAEYATEENAVLARTQDITVFGREIAQLQDDMTRLEKTIEQVARLA